MQKIKKYIEKYIDRITDEETSQLAQSETIFLLFSIIAAVMCILNLVTGKTLLMIATCIFAALCFVDYIMIKLSDKTLNVANVLFAIEIVLLFTYFIITGGTDNFSTIWILLLPALGLFFFGVKTGTVLCAVMLLIMLICFNVPALTDIVTDYTKTFRMRFPIVYIACYFVALFIEMVKRNMMRRLTQAKEKFSFLYNHDYLTGAKNRYTADADYKNICAKTVGNVGIAMFDIDFFRDVNTKIGHAGGDYVLTNIVFIITKTIGSNGEVYRWGGEEFLVIFKNGDIAEKACLEVRKNVEDFKFCFERDNLNLTISGGLYIIEAKEALIRGFNPVIEKADVCLYEAKNSGRNRIITKHASEEHSMKYVNRDGSC